MNFYQNFSVFFITYKFIVWLMITQTILYRSSVASNHFDYNLSNERNLPFIHYHGVPQNKEEMKKKDAMDTYNLALTNDMDLTDGKNYRYATTTNKNNRNSLEIPFYWVVDVDDQKHNKNNYKHVLKKYEKKNSLSDLQKVRDETSKKSHYKSLSKSDIDGDHERSNELEDESKRYQHGLAGKQSNEKSSSNIDSTTSETSMDRTKDKTKKNSKKLNQITKSTNENEESQNRAKKPSLKNSNRKVDKTSTNKPKVDPYYNSDDARNSLKNKHKKHKSSSKTDKKESITLGEVQTDQLDNNSDNLKKKRQKPKSNAKVKEGSSEIEHELNNSKNKKRYNLLVEDTNGIKNANQMNKCNKNSSNEAKTSNSELDKNLSNETDSETSDETEKDVNNSKKKHQKPKLSNQASNKPTNKFKKTNLKNKYKQQKLSNAVGKRSNTKINAKTSSGSDEKSNDSAENEHNRVSRKQKKNLKNKHGKRKSGNKAGKRTSDKLKVVGSDEIIKIKITTRY